MCKFCEGHAHCTHWNPVALQGCCNIPCHQDGFNTGPLLFQQKPNPQNRSPECASKSLHTLTRAGAAKGASRHPEDPIPPSLPHGMSAGQTDSIADGPGRQTGSCGFACGQHHVVEPRPGWIVLNEARHSALSLACWPGGLRPITGRRADQGEGDGETTPPLTACFSELQAPEELPWYPASLLLKVLESGLTW